MKPKAKSKFFAFLCSFLPGAVEMYYGFMKTGLTLLAIFFACLAVPMVIGTSDVFFCVSIAVWFYGFFHARNMVHCTDEEIEQLEDHYIWNEIIDSKTDRKVNDKKFRKWTAIIVIIVGAGLLWSTIFNIACSFIPDVYWADIYPVLDRVPAFVISVLVIIVGILLIKGKKQQLEAEANEAPAGAQEFAQITDQTDGQ